MSFVCVRFFKMYCDWTQAIICVHDIHFHEGELQLIQNLGVVGVTVGDYLVFKMKMQQNDKLKQQTQDSNLQVSESCSCDGATESWNCPNYFCRKMAGYKHFTDGHRGNRDLYL